MTSHQFSISLDIQELRAIIFCMQNIDSGKYLKGRNGMYLDHYEKQLLTKLQKQLAKQCGISFEELLKTR